MPLAGEVRSASCGSRLRVGLALDEKGAISAIGLAAQACAIGQAAAAVMAEAVIGRDLAAMQSAERDIARWLAGEGDLPSWPGLAQLAAARDYPGRHGAFMLGWRGVLVAFAPVVS
ncbi:MAG: iron-sulfur cluster assembly scaffold protein [Sphingomonadales bacterium]|nr:iron-sulfur cluster assembly scaffold protein [Sphingomonadales bacterium]MDE2170235.1 iron-sulfur cluster assembly scaffold protein [Sphingomonadales bacterium]